MYLICLEFISIFLKTLRWINVFYLLKIEDCLYFALEKCALFNIDAESVESKCLYTGTARSIEDEQHELTSVGSFSLRENKKNTYFTFMIGCIIFILINKVTYKRC